MISQFHKKNWTYFWRVFWCLPNCAVRASQRGFFSSSGLQSMRDAHARPPFMLLVLHTGYLGTQSFTWNIVFKDFPRCDFFEAKTFFDILGNFFCNSGLEVSRKKWIHHVLQIVKIMIIRDNYLVLFFSGDQKGLTFGSL